MIKLKNKIFMIYKSYAALMSQDGINAPTAIVLNSSDPNYIGDIVWTYDSIGTYIGTLNNAFPIGKVFILLGNTIGAGSGNQIFYAADIWQAPDKIYINVCYDGYFSDGQMINNPIEIRVYQ